TYAEQWIDSDASLARHWHAMQECLYEVAITVAYIEQVVDIDAAPWVVWSVIADVERWPEWTRSTRSIRLLDGGELRNTARARVRLQGLVPSTWQVTEFDAGRAFTWDTQAMPGLRMAARHEVEPKG